VGRVLTFYFTEASSGRLRRLTDYTYVPLGPAANAVLVSEEQIVRSAAAMTVGATPAKPAAS
jgi:hypothetical protein